MVQRGRYVRVPGRMRQIERGGQRRQQLVRFAHFGQIDDQRRLHRAEARARKHRLADPAGPGDRHEAIPAQRRIQPRRVARSAQHGHKRRGNHWRAPGDGDRGDQHIAASGHVQYNVAQRPSQHVDLVA